jgi:hypothetical protein
MRTKLFATAAIVIALAFQARSQGYLVPNGVITNYSGAALQGEISVLYNPTNLYYTGFALHPSGLTQPTFYTNTFSYDYILDVGVRVFLVSPNDPITQQAIQSGSYTELMYPNSYVFNHNAPFYVALYTGNQNFYPPNGIYTDPLFGWARLVNNQGVIQLLEGALVYKAEGIYTGTLNIIPEPSSFALGVLGVVLLTLRRMTIARNLPDRNKSAI